MLTLILDYKVQPYHTRPNLCLLNFLLREQKFQAAKGPQEWKFQGVKFPWERKVYVIFAPCVDFSLLGANSPRGKVLYSITYIFMLKCAQHFQLPVDSFARHETVKDIW